jgi:hypothetical protein
MNRSPVLSHELWLHDASCPLLLCKARERRPWGRNGIEGGSFLWQERVQMVAILIRLKMKGSYRDISMGLQDSGYFLPSTGKKCLMDYGHATREPSDPYPRRTFLHRAIAQLDENHTTLS